MRLTGQRLDRWADCRDGLAGIHQPPERIDQSRQQIDRRRTVLIEQQQMAGLPGAGQLGHRIIGDAEAAIAAISEEEQAIRFRERGEGGGIFRT